jgi:hypothetical protein
VKVLRNTVLAAAAIGALYLALLVAYTMGEASVRRSTTVKIGVPVFKGTFYGECVYLDPGNRNLGQACASDGRRD